MKGAVYGVSPYAGALLEGEIFRLSPPTGQTKTWTYQDIYDFVPANKTAPFFPSTGLALTKKGNLIGLTNNNGEAPGTVYLLAKPPSIASQWSLAVLHSFGQTPGDGANPIAAPILDPHGNVFGTTYEGGVTTPSNPQGCGTVWEIPAPIAK